MNQMIFLASWFDDHIVDVDLHDVSQQLVKNLVYEVLVSVPNIL